MTGGVDGVPGRETATTETADESHDRTPGSTDKWRGRPIRNTQHDPMGILHTKKSRRLDGITATAAADGHAKKLESTSVIFTRPLCVFLWISTLTLSNTKMTTTSSAPLTLAGDRYRIIIIEPDLALEHYELLDSKSRRHCVLVSSATKQQRRKVH